GRDADGELFGQSAERARQRGSVVVTALGQTGTQVLHVDASLGMDREADLDRGRVEAQCEESVPGKGAGIFDLRRDRATAAQEEVELAPGRLIAPEEDPLAVDALLVAERGVLVGPVHVHGDTQLREASDDDAGPGEGALLQLEAGPRVSVRRRLLRR